MHPSPTELSTPGLSPLTLDQCAYSIGNERVIISIGKIANHRDPADVSGTLSVELWALDRPYSGGNFDGVPLAGTSIGEMLGQHFLTDCRYDLIFRQPPTGTWYLTLMLREWTAAGYVTRDYLNFALPYVVETRPVVRSESDNVISIEFAGSKKRLAAPAESEDKARPVAAVPIEASAVSPMDPVPEPGVSLNSSSPKEIAAVKGISKKVAENIVAARPFDSVEELLRVKGMGAKLLQKVRRFFRL
jgi:DNA uptake protein ComE-like DNA-binding protein